MVGDLTEFETVVTIEGDAAGVDVVPSSIKDTSLRSETDRALRRRELRLD